MTGRRSTATATKPSPGPEPSDATAAGGASPLEPDEEQAVIDARRAEDAELPLVRKIVAAMTETARVAKRGRNKDQGYDFASAEDILNEVRGPLHGRGVLLTPRPRVYDEQTVTSSKGTEGTRLIVTIDFEFTDGDASYTVADWRGEGQDYGDKAYGKAYTNALKTFVRAQWLLPTGDDPEASDPGERIKRANGNGLPGWAKEASDGRKVECLNALAEVIGRPKANGLLVSMKDTFGTVPDIVVGLAKNLATLHAQANASPVDRAAEREERAEAERAAAEAEAPDEPVEEPPPGTGERDPSRPLPGSVPVPDFPKDATDDQKREALRAAGCTCKDPLDMGEASLDTECPVSGHGIPF